MMHNEYLMHYGVPGMKWGVRRYQNKDGSWTAKGKKHRDNKSDNKKSRLTDKQKRALKIGAAVAVTALAAVGTYHLAKSGKLDGIINVGKNKINGVLNKKGGSDSLDAIGFESNKAKALASKTGLKVRKTKCSIEEACQSANPDYNRNNPAYRNNCGKSVVSDVLNSIGMDVKAKGMDPNEQSGMTWFDVLRPFKESSVEDYVIPKKDRSSGISCKKTVSNKILEHCNGEDGLGIFRIESVGEEIGHYMKWQIKDGQVIFSNSQTGKMDVDRYFEAMALKKVKPMIEFSRLDKLDIDDTVIRHYVENR